MIFDVEFAVGMAFTSTIEVEATSPENALQKANNASPYSGDEHELRQLIEEKMNRHRINPRRRGWTDYKVLNVTTHINDDWSDESPNLLRAIHDMTQSNKHGEKLLGNILQQSIRFADDKLTVTETITTELQDAINHLRKKLQKKFVVTMARR